MAYTVKKVAAMSGVSVRTLHFYDETGLLKPAYCRANGYRFYEEPQLLTLQQILFYRELGFELKQIQRILGRANFEKVAALQSHRQVLQENLTRAGPERLPSCLVVCTRPAHLGNGLPHVADLLAFGLGVLA